MITDWKRWWKEVSSKKFEIRTLGSETEKKRCGQESRDKTACTKNSWRLLAMGVQRTVFQRRQLQFPSRYQQTWKNDTAESVFLILSCSRMREMRQEPEVLEESPSGRMFRWPCKDYLKGTCNNSFCEKWHPPECLFYKTKSGCRFGEKCSFAHRQVDEQPTKRSKKNDDKSAVAMLKKGDWQEREPVTDECHDRPGKPGKKSDKKLGQNSSKRQSSDARQLGCEFQDMTPPKSILRKGTDMPKLIQRVKFTKAIARHTKIRDQNPSLGYICPGEPHQRSPNAPKFEDRSQEETEWQERCAREAA